MATIWLLLTNGRYDHFSSALTTPTWAKVLGLLLAALLAALVWGAVRTDRSRREAKKEEESSP